MKLWNRNESIAGDWHFVLEYEGKRRVIRAQNPGLDALVSAVERYMRANSLLVPEYLAYLVEDQICMRQPPGKCRYTKAPGDLISLGITTLAGAIDAVAGTKLKEKTQKCLTCGKRRSAINHATSR